ncbi:MAG TPA: tetratricopeptide repeat protein, partial [Candidatus Sulfotelmatobacter sp.]|nr:tetratricopeptide repeat protein [Candidatus Sulfotelmatobacter sp.]
PIGLFDRGMLYLNLNRYSEAISDLTEALNKRDNDKAYLRDIYHLRAKAYQALGEREKAAADLENIKELGYSPDNK